MKARLPEAAGGKPGPAGRSGPASFSGPSSRTKTEGAAGAGLPVSGALGAALLAAAALLLAPGEARAIQECGAASLNAVVTCSGASYPDGIFYGGADTGRWLQGNNRINVPGSAGATTTITATTDGTSTQSVGVYGRGGTGSNDWAHIIIGGETDGTAHVVNIVQGTSTNTDTDRNNGVYFRTDVQSVNNSAATTIELRRGVTIGSAAAPMKQNGLWVVLGGSGGRGSGPATITSAAPIFAAKRGIVFARNVSNITGATTITNNGDISSGEEGIYLWYSRVVAPWVSAPLSTLNTFTGGATITNTGAIAVSGADKYGIVMNYRGIGAAEVDNSGAIDAPLGSGIHLVHANGDSRLTNNGAATLTNRGAVSAATLGLRLEKHSGAGATTLTNSGDVTVTADAAAGAGHAIWLTENGSGAVTITNSGDLSSKNHALYAVMGAAKTAALALTNSGAVASEDGDGIRLERGAEGDVTVTNSADVSGRWHGVYVGKAARIDFDQTAGTIAGRTGVTLGVSRENAMGDTRSVDDDGNHVPAIDVTWTGGSIARGTAENDNGRFRAASAAQALSFDQESAAGKALVGSDDYDGPHYGGPAGIEAHVLSWRDVVTAVAKGDDPFAFANNAAQLTAVPTGATADDNVYVKQLRAALGNDDLAVAPAVFEAIDSTATSLDDLTDAEIVTYLQTDNDATRALLRNILAQGLSDKEKAVLRAVATGDATALTIALDDADAGFPNDYKAAVQALRERHNIDDVRIAMTAGSIDSRGDGIRAYYATPNDSNGAISVTIAAGVTVTGGAAGVHVANAGTGLMVARKHTHSYAMGDSADELVAVTHGAGMDPLRNQLVTVAGTVTGGTDAALRLSGGGGVLVMEGGKVHAGASGVGILADGPALVYVDGEVRGGAGGAAAVHLSGGGSVTVGPNGRVQANGADRAIRSDNDAAIALTLVIDRLVPYRDDVNAQVDGSIEGVAEVLLREDRDGVPTGYSYTLGVTADGMMDTTKLPSRPKEHFDCAADGRCRITEGETISDRRTGVYAAVPRASAEGETRTAADQPLIDVTWTGTFSHGEGSNDRGRFTAASVGEALASDREASAGKAVEETVRWDAPAGIEAHVLSWRDVAEQVARGDDPGAIADAAAQTAAVPAGATRDNAYVAAFRAALGNEEVAVAAAVLEAIRTGATSVADLEDADVVAYLRTDDAVTRALLRDVLVQGLSEAEKKVLKAVATGDSADLTTALDAADAGFSDVYKTAVRALLERYNVGNIRVAMNGGSIVSRGDGIRAYYATPHERNGGIRVTVAEGASVTGALAGVYVANAGEGLMLEKKYTPGYAVGDEPDELVAVTHGEGADAVPLLDQLVTVAGTVTGGTDAAVHLNGGGAVIVEKGGRVLAGSSGVAILVNDPGPALVYIAGEVRGATGGAAAVHLTGGGDVIVGGTGRVGANGAEFGIRGDNEPTRVDVLQASRFVGENTLLTKAGVDDAVARLGTVGGDGVDDQFPVSVDETRDNQRTGYRLNVPRDDEGNLNPEEARGYAGLDDCPRGQELQDGECMAKPMLDDDDGDDDGDEMKEPLSLAFSCDMAGDGRCRMYEALPSMLLAMNALPSWAERRSAARDGDGGWARVEASRGKWQAKEATTTSGELAYDHRRSVGRAGVDFLAGESGRVGMSVHGVRGKAEMAGVGEVDLSGMGAGLSATWEVGEFQVDAQAAATWYDADLKSYTHGRLLKKEASGAGYALGVDVGRRMVLGELLVTPRAGLGWSRVDFLDFIDLETMDSPGRAEVSVEEAGSVQGRLGVTVERELAPSGRVFGSLDVEQEFSDETEVKVGGETLKTEARPTGVRLGLGGMFDVDENVVLRATGGWQTSGSGTSGYGGGLEVRIRF